MFTTLMSSTKMYCVLKTTKMLRPVDILGAIINQNTSVYI